MSCVPVTAFSRAVLLGRECGNRQPHNQQIDRRLLHQGQGAAQQCHVLRRLGVAVVHLGGAERVRGQFNLGADLVEEAIDRDRDRLAALIAGLARRLAHGRIGDRRKTGAADVAAGHVADVFGVAETDIHRSDDIVHVRLLYGLRAASINTPMRPVHAKSAPVARLSQSASTAFEVQSTGLG
jgi:hypothetical protein